MIGYSWRKKDIIALKIDFINYKSQGRIKKKQIKIFQKVKNDKNKNNILLLIIYIYLKYGQYQHSLMIKYFTKFGKLATRSFQYRILSFIHSKEGMRKLELYQKIKEKQMRNIRTNSLNEQSIQKFYSKMRCDGCNSTLQSQDKHKYGFIKQEVLDSSVRGNIQIIESTYGQKASRQDSKTLQVINAVEKEIGVKIFNSKTKKLDNLDNVEVLLRLQQKIDQYQAQEQTIKRIKKQRNEIYCQRCYSLKYHNKLPDEFDLPEESLGNNEQVLMSKVFKKHKNIPTFYIYLVDVLDIAGSFKKYVFDRFIEEKVDFCIAINKLDIVNEKYLNRHKILDAVRAMMLEFISERDGNQQKFIKQKIQKLKVVLISSIDRSGVKGLQEYIQKNLIHRIQLVGFPNTGKTTLLNQLARMNRPTSKVPGTTVFITEHHYKKMIIYDMPGMNSQANLCNKISRPNLKTLLAWNKLFSPPVLLHHTFFFGGKVEIQGAKIIMFGLGGMCSSDNRWFILNYKQFWKGLPPLHELQIEKHKIDLFFENGKSDDLQIAGWGFIAFRLANGNLKKQYRELTLYLPKGIQFHLRRSILEQNEILNYKSVVKKRFRLERVLQQRQNNI